MNSQGDMLSLLDLLDLNEEIVDSRLKSIMVRSNHTNEHLTNALQLLRYKNLINVQEKSECNNADEFDFVVKLIKDINTDVVENICKITTAVLQLNSETLVSYSEHLLSQILGNLDWTNVGAELIESEPPNALLYLKVCDSILNLAIFHGEKLSMLFLETSLEEILRSRNEQLKVHFITSTVPKLAEGTNGYDILSRIWNFLEKLQNKATALKVLSSLSDFYLPVCLEGKNARYESTLVYNENFWDVVLHGLLSDDPSLRKISVYLAKRAIDYIGNLKTNVNVKLLEQTLFTWDHKNHDQYKTQWDNFFILIDSLEEKQSNIVLPSLQLFDGLTVIGHNWLNCAYNLGLKHDNSQVRLKCIEQRIKANIQTVSEAVVLLGALNDINFYDNKEDCKNLKNKLSELLKNDVNLIHLLGAIPHAHLSPVPFYHITDIISNLDLNIDLNKHSNMLQIIIDLLKTSCNIIPIREAVHFNVAHFVGKACQSFYWRDIASIHTLLQFDKLTEENALFNLINDCKLNEKEKQDFLKYVTDSHSNINCGLLYLNSHPEDVDLFMEIIYKKGKSLQDILNRQYSNKMDCFNDAIYILNLQEKCDKEMKQLLPNAYKTILQYTLSLLSSDTNISIDENKSLFNTIHYEKENNLKVIVLQLYKTAILLMKDIQTDLNKMVQSLLIIESLSNNDDFVHDFSHELIDLKHVLQLEVIFQKKTVSNVQSLGRFRNVFYETHSKLVGVYLSSVMRRQYLEESSFEDLSNNPVQENKQKSLNEICDTVSSIFARESHVKQEEKLIEEIKINNLHVARAKLEASVIKINDLNVKSTDWKQIVDYVEKVIDCGGYGCLEWVLRMINETFEHTNTHLNIPQFIGRMWREIEELKSSNHYVPCMREFVNLITQKALITKPEFNNIVVSYCSKIIEYGLINNSPLYFLIHNEQLGKFIEEQNRDKKLNEYGHLLYVLSEILLFCPVPRKDQRIADNLIIEIMIKDQSRGTKTKYNFNFEIQYHAVNILSKIDDADVLKALTIFIRAKVDNTFKAKFRYHSNSQIHRTLQTALQHLLFIRFLKLNADDDEFHWCLDLLGRMPHQQSIRICLEWYIALHIYLTKTELTENIIRILQSKNIPLTSQMTIFYWLIKPVMEKYSDNEQFHIVMRTLLSHTMGQMFNIRLLAQYLAIKLHNGPQAPNCLKKEPIYYTIIAVISKTLDDNVNDKNYVKLKEDYFMNDFAIIPNLTPFFIYHILPRFCEVGNNEDVRISVILKIMDKINERIEKYLNPDLKEEWIKDNIRVEELIQLEKKRIVIKNTQEDLVAMGTIQKKYIPWKSMSDINVYNVEKKRESPSDLIVVASLIDKLPNLGGMARTSEVFGVKTYVIDSLRHLQDRQFQGLSVSAEKWIDVEEVRPGAPLKEYLNQKKAEGYSVVAAEQTSTSSKLQKFKFPRKTLLLLGHEKEGIPCDLLPMMDHCIEIPQQGFVRSLNVHVTAAIFVWEYARQNVL